MATVKIEDIINIIEEFAPNEVKPVEMFDNSGLLYGDLCWAVKGVMITLDLTPDVVQEAIDLGCNLIIEHHPTIFLPLNKIDIKSPNGKVIEKCIKNKIAIYAAHINVDFTKGGLNDVFACLSGAIKHSNVNEKDITSPRIGKLEKSFKLKDYVCFLEKVFDDETIYYCGNPDRSINIIACSNGGGGSDGNLLQSMEAGADVFISSDFKHHTLRLAKDSDYAIISISHFRSEYPFIELMNDLLIKKGVTVPIHKTTKCIDPVQKRRN